MKATRFDIIEYPKTKKLQDSKEFSRYLIRGEMKKGHSISLFFIKKGKESKKKNYHFNANVNAMQAYSFIPLK